jgi:hypothetical protein
MLATSEDSTFCGRIGSRPISKSQNRHDRPHKSEESGPLEENIEVSSEQALVIAEKYSVLRVTGVRMNI